MRLLIARHGETEENLLSICQGQTAGTLTRRGWRNACNWVTV
nr:histidine phosphatase family protein [Porphyromonas uenonis]